MIRQFLIFALSRPSYNSEDLDLSHAMNSLPFLAPINKYMVAQHFLQGVKKFFISGHTTAAPCRREPITLPTAGISCQDILLVFAADAPNRTAQPTRSVSSAEAATSSSHLLPHPCGGGIGRLPQAFQADTLAPGPCLVPRKARGSRYLTNDCLLSDPA